MADLGSTTTDRRLAFVKYVVDNKRFAEIDFVIEKGKSTTLFTKKGTTLVSGKKEYGEGTKLKIVSNKLHEISGMRLAEVKIGTVKGFVPINKIRKPTTFNSTRYEQEVVDGINEYIRNSGGPIDIKIKGDNKIYKDILYAVKVDTNIKRKGGVKGDPKADIILCRDAENPLDSGSIYISHKKEGGAEAFQQYGGISKKAGEKIYNHPLVQSFLERVVSILGNSNRLPAPVMATFGDKELINMSIYGPDYGQNFSLQHVQLIAQGKPKLSLERNHVVLDFTDEISLSGNVNKFTEGYTPVFAATFRSGRGFEYKNKSYSGARVGIYPKSLIETRNSLITFEL